MLRSLRYEVSDAGSDRAVGITPIREAMLGGSAEGVRYGSHVIGGQRPSPFGKTPRRRRLSGPANHVGAPLFARYCCPKNGPAGVLLTSLVMRQISQSALPVSVVEQGGDAFPGSTPPHFCTSRWKALVSPRGPG